MPANTIKNRRLVALFLLGCVLFNYPLLSLFNLDIMVMGIPLLYLYLFGGWFLLILFIALATLSRMPSLPIPERQRSRSSLNWQYDSDRSDTC